MCRSLVCTDVQLEILQQKLTYYPHIGSASLRLYIHWYDLTRWFGKILCSAGRVSKFFTTRRSCSPCPALQNLKCRAALCARCCLSLSNRGTKNFLMECLLTIFSLFYKFHIIVTPTACVHVTFPTHTSVALAWCASVVLLLCWTCMPRSQGSYISHGIRSGCNAPKRLRHGPFVIRLFGQTQL